MVELFGSGRLLRRSTSAVASLSLMSSLAWAVSKLPEPATERPMQRFVGLNLETYGLPAILLLITVALWNRWLTSVLNGPRTRTPGTPRRRSRPAGILSTLETDPGPCVLSFGTGFLWISILHASLSEPGFWWLDFGAYAWPLTWAAVCGPWFIKKYWTKENSGRAVAQRMLLLVIGLLGLAGWIYQLLPLVGL